ncbi:hypothetical protein [Sandarakinorhabdus sp.]|uniref:hypothetical protein n=1 Tax=Sandarakinorhabdus sp. TaxID=1916663 RepID=UPI00286DA9E8|nr:hypothetical protein [Sandarakinorhabdus sp.]
MSGARDRAFARLGPPETWGAFNAADLFNAACERERRKALAHCTARLKAPRQDQGALLVGMMFATLQLYASSQGVTMFNEDHQQNLRDLLEFAMVAGVDSFSQGETPQ